MYLYRISEMDPIGNILSKKHQGATGNLGIAISDFHLKDKRQWLHAEMKKWEDVLRNLLI